MQNSILQQWVFGFRNLQDICLLVCLLAFARNTLGGPQPTLLPHSMHNFTLVNYLMISLITSFDAVAHSKSQACAVFVRHDFS